MATIPAGAGRRVLPGSANPMGQGGAPAVGMATGRALEQLGQVGANIGLDMMAQDTRLQAEETHRQLQLAEAAARQKDMLALQQGEDAMRDAHDEVSNGVLNGTIPKDQAGQAWTERAGKIIEEASPNVRPQSLELAQRQLQGLSARLGNGVRQTVEKRDREDISSGIAQTLEFQARQYATDPAKAQQMVNATIDQLGPFSNYSPEQLGKMKQGWRESTQYTQAFEAISAGRDDRKALSSAEQLIGQLPDLDPQRRASLIDKAQAYRLALDQKDELRAQRAQREAERRLNLAQAEFQTFQAMADKGTVLAPEYIDRVSQATAGTPYQAGVLAMAKQAKEAGGLAAQPVGVQRNLLTAVDAEIAQKGRTPELDQRRQQIEKVLKGSEQDLQQDPLRAGLERGVITELPALNMGGGIAGLVQQLGERVTQAQRVGTWAGRPVAPLTSQEAQGLASMLKSQSADQRATSIQTLAATMPAQQAQALAALMDKDDRPTAIAMALGGARTTFDRPTAELVLRGAEAIKNKTIKEEKTPVDGWMGRINQSLAGVYSNPQQAQMVGEAARYILAGMISEGQASGGEEDARRAVRVAVGGTLVDQNGSRIVLPAGVERKDLAQRLSAYPAPALQAQLPDGKVYVRGQPVELQQFLAGLPAAQLRTVGRGRYAVIGGGAIATNSNMDPIVIEVPNAR